MKSNGKTPMEFAEQLLADGFSWLIGGKKRYLTIPLTIIFILCVFFPAWRDNFLKSYKVISDLISPTTYITRDELDVINEWIIVIWSYDDKELANSDYKKLCSAYKQYGDTTQLNDIHLVRSCKAQNSWMLTFDYGTGKQTKEAIIKGIEKIKKDYNDNRTLLNNLGQTFDDCYPLYYCQKDFEYINGKIININHESLLVKK